MNPLRLLNNKLFLFGGNRNFLIPGLTNCMHFIFVLAQNQFGKKYLATLRFRFEINFAFGSERVEESFFCVFANTTNKKHVDETFVFLDVDNSAQIIHLDLRLNDVVNMTDASIKPINRQKKLWSLNGFQRHIV